MRPRKLSLIALSLFAIAASVALFHHPDQNPSQPVKQGKNPILSGHSQGKHQGSSSLPATESLTQETKQSQLTLWSKNGSAGLALSLKNLIADLHLSPEETAAVKQIFARRDAELTALLTAMHSGIAADDRQHFTKICALLRNKGLRNDLSSVLSANNLAAFDANEANRQQQSIEARAYRDMADLNSVVLLNESQKQQALAALINKAPGKIEHEADTRAFLTLNYGQMLTDINPASIRGLTNLAHQLTSNPLATPDIDSPQYRQRSAATKAERIARDLSTLQNILDEKQLARYRQHLEAEPAW